MNLTQKIRIFPSKNQKLILWDLSEKCRLIYNFALAERIENWNKNKYKPKDDKKYISYLEQQNKLPLLKKKYPEYKWVYSKVLQMILKRLNSDYKSFFTKWINGDKQARPPKFKSKKRFTTICYNQSGFKLEKKVIQFSHKHPSKIPLIFSLKYPYCAVEIVKQVEIFKDFQNRWFISITYEVQALKYKDNGLYQAIDLGVSNIVSAVNLHSKFIQIKNKRADLYWKKKIESIQSRRDHCKKYSKKWRKYHYKFRKMHQKCAYQMRDFQHKISKHIVTHTKANTIIVGDLNVKEMAKKKKSMGNAQKNKANKTLNYSVNNTGSLGRFVEFLIYKARLVGKRVIRIDESYTTQRCSICGKLKKRNLSERIIQCDCGNYLDRDLNSVINIMIKFLKHKHCYVFLSHQPSLNEESFLQKKDLLRYTAPSVVKVMADS